MNKSQAINEFTILDWIGIVYIVGHILGLFAFPKMALTFNEMFMEFGGSLPVLTEIVINPWFSMLLGLACICIFSLQWLKPIKSSIRRRRAVIVLSFIGATISFAICIIGIYQPIFKMASPIG